MRRISLVKIAAALIIVNAYMFTCGVVGSVGGITSAEGAPLPDGTAEAGGQGGIGEAAGQGTLDFLVPDETSTGYVELDLLNLAPVPLSGKMVQSTYSARSEATTSAEPEEDPDDEIVITLPEETEEAPQETTPTTPATTTTAATTTTVSTTTATTTEPTTVTTTEPATEPTTSANGGGIPVDDPVPGDQPDVTEPQDEPDPGAAEETLYVRANGSVVSGTALDIVSRITQQEVGYTFAPEAIKAQAVAAYTYVKFCNEYGTYPSVALASTVSDSVMVLVQSVIGKAIYYNGSIIQAVYSASSAGYTASSMNVWGTDYPYLASRFCDLDAKYDPNYGRTAQYSADEIKSRVLEKTGIELSGDPSGWLSIEARIDGNYVGQMSVGGYHSYTDSSGNAVKITGRVFRERIMGFDLRSSSFDIAYDSGTDTFTFTTYGYGHGVGLSQNGANALATYLGYDYKQILTYYYSGVEVR